MIYMPLHKGRFKAGDTIHNTTLGKGKILGICKYSCIDKEFNECHWISNFIYDAEFNKMEYTCAKNTIIKI